MKLPNNTHAFIPDEKLVSYLLAETHPVGGPKARWLRSLGYRPDRAELLRSRLIEIARTEDVVGVTETEFGTKYVVDGVFESLHGRPARIRTAWIVNRGREHPQFVTAHPL